MQGELIGNTVVIGKQAIDELYNTSFYGRPRKDELLLSLAESAYLIYAGKISVAIEGKELDFKHFFLKASTITSNFELLYIVYKDLRERGYYVQPGVTGFRVYPRGGHPGKTPAEFFVFVISERAPLPLYELDTHINTVENLKKRLVLSIVDEESDITYYYVKKTIPKGSWELDRSISSTSATVLEDRCIVWDSGASDLLHETGFFGKRMDEGHLQLSLVESCFLLNRGILVIERRDNEILDFDAFLKLASHIESDFLIKFKAYEKLRNSGLIPKTGYKFGTHFRVYKKFENISGISHSDFLVHAVEKNHVFSLQQLSRAVRLANSVRKEMIYAAVTDSHVEFLSIGRMRL